MGIIFLKYVSGTFDGARVIPDLAQDTDPEDSDEYRARNMFWVLPEGCWSNIKAQASQPIIGQMADGAMAAIKDMLSKNHARPASEKTRLGRIIDLISNIRIGDKESRSKYMMSCVYEYFLSGFANAQGKKGGRFYTPRSVVRLLVEMLRPYDGRVYDPRCGPAGMFVWSAEFIRAHAGGNGNRGRAEADVDIHD